MSVDPTGRYRIIPASIGGAYSVLTNLSVAELQEIERLGAKRFQHGIYKAVAEDRAWTIVDPQQKSVPLALLGYSPEGTIWFLPTELCVHAHKRSLANKEIVNWAVSYLFEQLPEGFPKTLSNGVTEDAKDIRAWLTRIVGARFSEKAQPTKYNGVLALKFTVDKPEAAVVRT